MPTKQSFAKQDLIDVIEDDSDNLEFISDEIVDASRWTLIHALVFREKSSGNVFIVNYSEGATEYQDERPFANEGDTVDCFLAKQVMVPKFVVA